MNDWIINLGISLLSGVLAPFIVSRLGGGTATPAQSASVAGDNNTVTQLVDNATYEEHIYKELPGPPAKRSPSASGSDDETVGLIVAVVVAGAALALAYLFVWPVIVWAFVGSAVGIAVMTTWTFLATRGTSGPRVTALTMTLASASFLLLAAWWTLHGGPGSSVSFERLDADVTEHFSAFGEGVSGRWEVTSTHPVDIVQILGWRGVLYILTQVIALEIAALLVWARAREVTGWLALHSLAHDPRDKSLSRRASRFKHIGFSAATGTLLGGVMIVVVTGGWLHAWIEDAQERQAESIVDTR